MPTLTTYPGVYVKEISSGVRTVTGVSTSVTAFLGAAKRGPINKAVHILSFTDFEQRFGGLDSDSEMSYAVRQFFMNGGSDAWVVRLAKTALTARYTLATGENKTGTQVITVTALDAGLTGNNIELAVDYVTAHPDSTFNLVITYNSGENPEENVIERYSDLSMNHSDPRSVFAVIADGVSRLVTIEPTAGLKTALTTFSDKGKSISGSLLDSSTNQLLSLNTLLNDQKDYQMEIAVNGEEPVTFKTTKEQISGADDKACLENLCGLISSAVTSGNAALQGFTCVFDETSNKITLTSGEGGEASSVRVSPGMLNDLASILKLSPVWGGTEVDAVASFRPSTIPEPGSLKGGAIAKADLAKISNAACQFLLSLDGGHPETVSIKYSALTGDLNAQLQELAGRIETSVHNKKPGNDPFANFSCTVDGNSLILKSGSRGAGSSVVVSKDPENDVAEVLHLTSEASLAPGKNVALEGGNEGPFSEDYDLFIASRKEKKGIYALEDVDLFNILCLPGVSDPGILADAAAYCEERRAFFIIDAMYNQQKPEDMVNLVAGTSLPKTSYAAVYYPWLKIPDPKKNGVLKERPPSGTIAGLYARIDSTRGVWKAPAGTEATLTGVQAMDYPLSDRENGTLNPLGVNCLRIKPVYGAICWGARTLRGADQDTSEWKYVPVRRLANFIEESLFRGTQWVVFEPNDEPLWAQIRLNIGSFMHNLFVQGAFQGQSPKEAYFVKCDKETTTQTDINLGVVNIIVGFAPLTPAEFVIIKIQQIAGQMQT